MKVALVHDYIKEYGGAERVLEVLSEIFPQAPIYTAFCKKNSPAYEHFKDKQIVTSWVQYLPFFPDKLYSPLRFLIPLIWGSFNLAKYDLVISSASWYVTKGFGHHKPSAISNKPIEICYCHTPPRWLYGYTTSVNFQKYLPVRIYALLVGHFLRLYDFKQAQKVDYFIANSKEVQSRIKKFYRRDSTVIYPPVSLPLSRGPVTSFPPASARSRLTDMRAVGSPSSGATPYYFIVSRIVGAKGLELAVDAALKMGFKLKIAGSPAGYYFEHNKLVKKARSTSSGQAQNVEFLGQVSDQALAKLYAGAKGFLALSKDEDFGITPVESQLCGTPVIAYNGGGYKETVIDGKTGVLFNDYSVDGFITAIKRFEGLKFNSKDCIENAQKFSKERFRKEIKEFATRYAGVARS
jgi:glycosyltransferase involved in cell wall biosynthesis